MINLLVGPPGGGKSYEAVVFHILPSLKEGRKVITNLPLNLSLFRALDPAYGWLIEYRTMSKDGQSNPFSQRCDYGDMWKHPETGTGPLYVIDEAHECLSVKEISDDVIRWYATHRHEYADVLLITQQSESISKEITGRVQLTYRVKKAVALGKANGYIRKVQDGIKGGIIDCTERRYEPKFFKLYTSYTHSVEQGLESDVKDVRPRYRLFFRFAFVLLALGLSGMAYSFKRMYDTQLKTKTPSTVSVQKASAPAAASRPEPVPLTPTPAPIPAAPIISETESIPKPKAIKHPYQNMELQIVGFISSLPSNFLYYIDVHKNGQCIGHINSSQLVQKGYRISVVSDCTARISYPGIPPFYAHCQR